MDSTSDDFKNQANLKEYSEIAPLSEPFKSFQDWFERAEKSEISEVNAAALATCGSDGQPSVRMVLVKNFGEDGFVFFTNLESDKAQDLADNPSASLLFYWKSQRRQVRIEGPVEPVSEREADAYFASRPRSSRIGAWASKQSRPMKGKFELETRVAKYTAKYGIGSVPRPEFWSGFRVLPKRMEFWQDREFRLHERTVYIRESVDNAKWNKLILFP